MPVKKLDTGREAQERAEKAHNQALIDRAMLLAAQPQRPRYETTIIVLAGLTTEERAERLNALGGDGWKIAAGDAFMVFLQREVA